ncbi:L-aspartate oxidase [Actinomarinicola tropica]|uniref:L-aspartate oxidase n=1 Tax=Actinomarinicola tropica TaxID=2789776 RepID=A0A5Q2RKY3_9ACTN|nr:FAD-dependent oxidoreductase [Actinomarinicola tropica]QGG96493.1 FAD-binding protein [Actinomarinicola tropica]
MPDSSLDTHLDLLVVGSGVAGLSAAVRAAGTHGMRVGIVTKGELTQTATRWAQGGVAAVLGGDPDSTDLHLADTLAAGAGLCDVDAVRVLVEEGPSRVNELISFGAAFDLDESGQYLLAREGGHSLPRILHAGGAATGVEVERALVEAVRATATLLHEHTYAVDLVVEGGRCRGVLALEPDGTLVEVRAEHVLLATGGSGQLFSVTTNPPEATADGVAMALRSGVAVADVEFVQFHPTALHHPSMPRPLLSEALRGHGALIRDVRGERFVDELLPRDQVSKAMMSRMLELGVDHCYLDARHLERFAERFPTITTALAAAGLDPGADLLPIAPAAHYHCGGVLTDLDGAASLPGLWAAGEVAASGVHGANRLASNSLLDGMVFGFRCIEAIEAGRDGPRPTGAMRALIAPEGSGPDDQAQGLPGRRLERPVLPIDIPTPSTEHPSDAATLRDEVQAVMTRNAGVVRDVASLTAAASALSSLASRLTRSGPGSTAHLELRNLIEAGAALVEAALAREESRGCHTRSDAPEPDDALLVRFVLGG